MLIALFSLITHDQPKFGFWLLLICFFFSYLLLFTDNLKEKILNNCTASKKQIETVKPLKLYIDGPFCSPVQDVFSFKISICIAGGIGVTPFSSIFSFLK